MLGKKVVSTRLAALTFTLTLGLFCCVGDEPAGLAADKSNPDAGAGDGATSPLESDASGASDSASACSGKEVSCGGTCADLMTSGDHCGTCAKSCGGGACVDGACRVATVRDDIEKLNGFAVDGSSLYFTDADKVMSCPVDACKGAPKQLAAMIKWDAERIFVDSGFLYFESAPNQSTVRPAIYRCPVDGCPNPPVSIIADGLNGIRSFKTFSKSLFANLGGSGIERVDCSSGACLASESIVPKPVGEFAVDSQRVYFNDTTGGGSQLATCPLAANCTTRTPLAAKSVLGPIVVAQNLVFFVGPGVTNGGHGVFACPPTGSCVPAGLTTTAEEIKSLAADAAGIYWTQTDKLMGCADVTCAGGPKTLAEKLDGISLLQLDSKFIYFASTGTTPGKLAIKRLSR